LTQRLQQAAKLLGIRLLDHIVVGHGRYVSFADRGWM
jgi:DNA repair protein RadC